METDLIGKMRKKEMKKLKLTYSKMKRVKAVTNRMSVPVKL